MTLQEKAKAQAKKAHAKMFSKIHNRTINIADIDKGFEECYITGAKEALAEKPMNRKLRLVVTDRCHNSCPMCCNNRFDLSALPIVEHWNYDEIMLTGGEPMLFPNQIYNLIYTLRDQSQYLQSEPKLYLYTALPKMGPLYDFIDILDLLDGVVVTPHTKKDAEDFKFANAKILSLKDRFAHKSLRLNIFPEVKPYLEGIDLSMWQIKEMQWIKDCPVPEGEDLRRINNLFR